MNWDQWLQVGNSALPKKHEERITGRISVGDAPASINRTMTIHTNGQTVGMLANQ